MSFVIRPMVKSDLDAVFDIELRAHVSPWSRGIIHDCIEVGYQCYVLAKKRRVLGFYIARVAANECHLLNLCIMPEAQGKGYGKALLDYLIQKVKPQCAELLLEVRPSNTTAIALYEKTQFKRIGERKNYYTNPDNSKEDALMYSIKFDLFA